MAVQGTNRDLVKPYYLPSRPDGRELSRNQSMLARSPFRSWTMVEEEAAELPDG